jgi:hypothetical protein
LRTFDVPRLCRFVAAREHDDHYISAPREIQPIARPNINTHLRNFAADRLPVTKISGLCKTNARSDSHLRPNVFQIVQPILKFLSLLNSVPRRNCIQLDTKVFTRVVVLRPHRLGTKLRSLYIDREQLEFSVFRLRVKQAIEWIAVVGFQFA